jgi:cobalt-zinc-cadmium efflux system membrane fusion protein
MKTKASPRPWLRLAVRLRRKTGNPPGSPAPVLPQQAERCTPKVGRLVPVRWPRTDRVECVQICLLPAQRKLAGSRRAPRNPLALHALAAAGALLAGCGKTPEAAPAAAAQVENNQAIIEPGSPAASAVSVEAAVAPAAETHVFNGRVVWDDNVTTRLFSPFAGRVTQIRVETGDSIEAGAPLCAIASPDFGQAQADARRAETDYALAERTATRLRALAEHGAAAAKDVQAAEADLARAGLEQERTAKRLMLYGPVSNLDQSFVLKSPIGGIIAERNINPGAELRNDQMLANTPQLAAPLFVITDPTKLWVQIDVPEREQSLVRSGQTFVLRCDSLPGQTFTGRVDVVADSLDPATHTLKVRGSLANPERRLKAESFVKVEFPLPPAGGAEVSSRAVFLRGDKHCVLVEEKPGHYAIHEVSVGRERGGRLVITQGVAAGQRVVVDGAMLLVQMIESGPTA